MNTIGQKENRVDALDKVKGAALYPGDFNMPNQVYMKILFAKKPHAIIKNIDTSQAEAIEGVLAVLTARDVPNNEYSLGPSKDQPVLCGPGAKKEYTDRVRFIGDQVALVIAESVEIAEHAKQLIKVEYEELPVITDPREAIKEGAFLIHPERKDNILSHKRIMLGDVEEAFKKADLIVEGSYVTPAQEHAYLQPEAGVSYIDEEGRVTVVVSGQWTHEDQRQIAHALELSIDQVRVIYPAIGGAFGGREDMSIQIVLALAAWRLHQKGINRPVKIIWSREESIVGHHKRHPYYINAKWGVMNDGKIVAVEVDAIADCGAYEYTSTKVQGNATLTATGPYEVPNVKVNTYVVYTNNLPSGAFRGFGGPQGAFEAEMQINKVAEILNIDPIEIRRRNFLNEESIYCVGTTLPKGVSIAEVSSECAKAAGWTFDDDTGWHRKDGYTTNVPGKSHLKRGIGFSCGLKNVGFSFGYQENSWATIELIGKSEIEKAILYHASAEVGQGTRTALCQMAAEALQIPFERVHIEAMDTSIAGDPGSVSASRMTFMAGNAIKGAAEKALEKWNNEERPAKATYQYLAPKTTPLDPETGYSDPNVSYGYVAEAVEVEVDIETGMVQIVNVICADDVGKAINPRLVKGQIEGAVIQAAGYSILENFCQKDGYVQTPNLSTYLIPTILDIPENVESMILEYPDPRGPWGARGMGEMPFIPFAPAVAAAIKDATGVWIDEFPFIPERVLDSLGRLK